MAARPSLFIPGAAQPASLRAIAAAPNAPYPNSARPRDGHLIGNRSFSKSAGTESRRRVAWWATGQRS